jgi:hypothetical protein
MLKIFDNGVEQTEIVSSLPTIYPRRDSIKSCYVSPFKYKVEKHDYIPPAIVKLGTKTYIFPSGMECHPDTELSDIVEIKSQKQIQQEKKENIDEEPKTWKFESSSGGGTYTVRYTKKGTLTCDCPGVWRSKDRRCKHIKEVEKL